METVPTPFPLKTSSPKAKVFLVFLSMVLCTAALFLLQLKFFKPRQKDFYSFEVNDSRGRLVALSKYRGKASLVVNVASGCQHADANYKALQDLYREFGTSHFTVLAFPCNQFGESEPNSNQEIAAFARRNYGVSFPIFSKTKIIGSEAEPAFRFLVESTKTEPRWNFWKYLVNPQGQVVKTWKPEEHFDSMKGDVAEMVREIIKKRREDL